MTSSEDIERPYKDIERAVYNKRGEELYTWHYLHLCQFFKF